MTIGRLTHHASQVTLSSSNSAAVTVPNDGSVLAGDLLLAACVMPSGSRTFAISGGAGGWTSLGTAMQSGHMSQVWWRLAAAGDLGATITVTPSTGAIRQVLLLGSVRGVDQSSPVAATSNTSLSATTKTTPSASPASTVREVSIVWDSRGAATPQTSSWTAPAGQTRQAQAFTTSGSGACSGAWGDSDTSVSGTIGSRVWTADQSALGSSWTLSVKPAPTLEALTGSGEADAASALAASKRNAQGPAAEADAATPFAGSKQGALAAASASSAAQGLGGGKEGSAGVAQEDSSAEPFEAAKASSLTPSTSTETTQTLVGVKAASAGISASSETAQTLTGTSLATLGAALESEQATMFVTPGGATLGRAEDLSAANSFARRKLHALTAGSTAAVAGAFGGALQAQMDPAMLAVEARPAAGVKAALLARGSEADQALSLPGAVDFSSLNVDVEVGQPLGRWSAEIVSSRWEVSEPSR